MKKIFSNILIVIFFTIPTVLHSDYKNNLVLSMGLSAIIPGGGQILNGDYKKGLIFLSIELLALNQKSKYNKNGKKFIHDYEDYALEFWSVEKWLKDFYLYNVPGSEMYEAFINIEDDYYFNIWDYSHGVDFKYNNQTYSYKSISSIYPQVCQDVMENGGSCDLFIANPEDIGSYIVPWGELEKNSNGDLILDENGLPILDFSGVEAIRDYHFHEGLGKYPEFFAGWVDATLEDSRLENRTSYTVPMTDKKSSYQNIRNKSNKEFDKEEIMLSIVFLNHAISMFDAFLTNINRMKKIDVSSNIEYDENFNPRGIKLHFKW